jgi:predicted nucleic acid-binding protein
VVEEVRRYLPVLARKEELSLGLMEVVLDLLPLELVPFERYADWLGEAGALIGWRDPEDVPLLALALAEGCPVWSNEDFSGLEVVEVYTTADLLAKA